VIAKSWKNYGLQAIQNFTDNGLEHIFEGIKYTNGIKFKSNGYPDFAPYVYNKKQFDIQGLKGTYEGGDFAKADKLAGIDQTFRETNNLTWHHVENGKTMQLVPKDINSPKSGVHLTVVELQILKTFLDFLLKLVLCNNIN